MKVDHLLIPCISINSKQIEDVNVTLETIKILEGNIGSTLLGISLSNIFSDMSPWARETKEKINRWDHIKLKMFCTANETINKMKRQPTEWENIYANDTSVGG